MSPSLILLGAADPARAESSEGCDASGKHVLVAFTGEWNDLIREEALSDLAAALSPQSIATCAGNAAGRPPEGLVSTVFAELLEDGTVRIQVDDHLTEKRVARDIKLKDPDDVSSALIVAVAIDELLRATWAELAMRRVSEAAEEGPKPETPREDVGETLLEPAVAEPQRVGHRISVRAAVDAYVEGSTFFGGDISYGNVLFEAMQWSAFAGPRWVRSPEASDLGRVRADAITFGFSVDAPLVRTSRFRFGPELSLFATHAWFRGQVEFEREQDVRGSDFRGWAFGGRAGLFSQLTLDQAFLTAGTRVGVPFLALEVTDDRGVIGGMTGFEWSNAFGVGWWWP